MLKFFSSFTFLYAFVIGVLLVYGLLYYRSFVRSGYQRRRFPWVFVLVSITCFSFLYINIHAPLRLNTFSNLDHHFIKHEGFRVVNNIELGRSDTSLFPGKTYNRFVFKKEKEQLSVSSSYAEEPFYASEDDSYKLLSPHYPAAGHTVSIQCDSISAGIRAVGDTGFTLSVNGKIFSAGKPIRKGISGWEIFKDEITFINTSWYTNEKLVNSLKNILLLRDNVSSTGSGTLSYFLSGRLFRYASAVSYDSQVLRQADLVFNTTLADKSMVAWGMGFLDNNKNQFRVYSMGADSFSLLNRYPVSYPMVEEKKDDWTRHGVNKFLVSDSRDLVQMPSVFSEGFLFPAFNNDSSTDFSPVLLSYKKGAANEPLELQARFLANTTRTLTPVGSKLILPARTPRFSWVFSIQDSFEWKFGTRTLPVNTWQWLIFGTLLAFFLLIFGSSWLKRPDKLSWIWQLLACVTMVLLTTRFFLYWRYKSFPPYEGLDLPSQQQLNTPWNFWVIVLAGLLLAIVFGYGLIRFLYVRSRKKLAYLFNRSYDEYSTRADYFREENIAATLDRTKWVKRRGPKLVFFASWILVLVGGCAFGALNNFDPSTSRHLSIILMLAYFVFVFISYKHSPLVASAEKSWWGISTGRIADIIISNPVKVLLSLSLLGVFVFVDIGFAIIFLNFLLFNEAFLCINYAIAGLSAGSRRNARMFGLFGAGYLLLFIVNLLYAPLIFKSLLESSRLLYLLGYFLFALMIAHTVTRLMVNQSARKKMISGFGTAVLLFVLAFFFFPKQRILDKAAMTRYRIDVMTMPVEQAIETAYDEGKTWEPVIRAAQNQWFINTFIYEKNNPSVNQTGFHLLPHAPQNKGARYNAQATDLVASRFLIAEHGKSSVLLYVLLLLVPISLLASFYKLYPDFTNRINNNYPTITAGFSVLNYLLVTALLVILAATGRYIFFGQDLPFGSILSKQSILFPSILIIAIVLLFKNIPLERYPNRKKMIPGAILFGGLALLLLLVKPIYNKDKEFEVAGLSREIDPYIQLRLQPILDHFDTAVATRRLSLARKDQLFTDSVRQLIKAGAIDDAGKFFAKEIQAYTRSGFSRHLDQRRMLYLDIYSGRPQLAINDNYFRIEPPPHLQQAWTGNVFGDTSSYNITLWNAANGVVMAKRITSYTDQPSARLSEELELVFRHSTTAGLYDQLAIVNKTKFPLQTRQGEQETLFNPSDTLSLRNPGQLTITDPRTGVEKLLLVQPDAFMKNYHVNGNRFYVYPLEERFIWARHFAESISSEYTAAGLAGNNAFVSIDAAMTDSLTFRIMEMMNRDTAYRKGAEFGICIADGNGRLIAMSDHIKQLDRPDPNDKAGFNKVIMGENGFVSQSLLRKKIGNINLLRLNPGPGSTLKPIVFSAIASQLYMDWDAFSAEGFSEPQQFYGGEKVAQYDFEKNNGRISNVVDYLRYSDNYYHSNLLLIGSYPRQSLQELLNSHFANRNPSTNGNLPAPHPEDRLHWPYFNYGNKQYWLNGFENWPGYRDGKTNFGTDSSFISTGLFHNFGIATHPAGKRFDRFSSTYDSALFLGAYRKSGFIMPETALFDQQGAMIDHRKPNEVFMACFRGHVKGSSQVMMPPVKMLDAFGKLITQNKNYGLTLDPYAGGYAFTPFEMDNTVAYSNYITIMRENVFEGMRQALFNGTAARLGAMLKDGAPWFYYAKTGTTGDDEIKSKSKLFTIVISEKDITDPGFNFRNNRFYTIYFTSQNGPAKQNEEFQKEIIQFVQGSDVFNKYMKEKRN